jgi:hypothetical protein
MRDIITVNFVSIITSILPIVKKTYGNIVTGRISCLS